MALSLKLPGANDRTTIIGATGTGKTVLGGALLSMQRLDKRPWVAMDFKGEPLWDLVGSPPMQEISFKTVPTKPGLYHLECLPGQEDELEDWLWKVWRKTNIGLFCDEATLIPDRSAFKAILRQGRSKLIPVIACTQRPVDCQREIFSESQYICVFRVDDIRDYKIIKGFTRDAAIEKPLPKFHSHWYDKEQAALFHLTPSPKPDIVASTLKARVPPHESFWGFSLR